MKPSKLNVRLFDVSTFTCAPGVRVSSHLGLKLGGPCCDCTTNFQHTIRSFPIPPPLPLEVCLTGPTLALFDAMSTTRGRGKREERGST